MSKVISTRIEEDLYREIEFVSRVENIDRSSAIKKLLKEGLRKWKIDYALSLYTQGKVSLWRAAKIANLSLWEFIDVLRDKKIELNLDEEDLGDE